MKIIFWLLYGLFGIIFIYTNIIWSHRKHTKVQSIDFNYPINKKGSNEKINIYGKLDSNMSLAFNAYMKSNDDHKCESIYFNYPMIEKNSYNVNLFLKYFSEDTNCTYKVQTLYMELKKRGIYFPHLKKAFHKEELITEYSTGDMSQKVQKYRGVADIDLRCYESSEKNHRFNTYSYYTHCYDKHTVLGKNIPKPITFEQLKNISLEMNILFDDKKHEFSGRSDKKTNYKIFSDAFEKFQVFKFPDMR